MAENNQAEGWLRLPLAEAGMLKPQWLCADLCLGCGAVAGLL